MGSAVGLFLPGAGILKSVGKAGRFAKSLGKQSRGGPTKARATEKKQTKAEIDREGASRKRTGSQPRGNLGDKSKQTKAQIDAEGAARKRTGSQPRGVLGDRSKKKIKVSTKRPISSTVTDAGTKKIPKQVSDTMKTGKSAKQKPKMTREKRLTRAEGGRGKKFSIAEAQAKLKPQSKLVGDLTKRKTSTLSEADKVRQQSQLRRKAIRQAGKKK